MRFDAPTLARAWLSVAQASGADKDLVELNRTVAIEEYLDGVQLVATDRFVLLKAWVPNVDNDRDREPILGEMPERTVIARDEDGRVRNLLGYALTLASREDPYEYGDLEIRLTFDARLPAGQEGNDRTLEGMEPVFTIFDVPDTEKVWCPVMQSAYPDWRAILHGFTRDETSKILLNPELVERVAKVRKWSAGPLLWEFGGPDRVSVVDFPESEPHVAGLVMPIKWRTTAEIEAEAAADPDPESTG